VNSLFTHAQNFPESLMLLTDCQQPPFFIHNPPCQKDVLRMARYATYIRASTDDQVAITDGWVEEVRPDGPTGPVAISTAPWAHRGRSHRAAPLPRWRA